MSTCFCRLEQKRGGVCVLHHNSIDIKPLPFITELATERAFECCGIEIISYNIILVCIYRIPRANTCIFFEKLSLLLDKLKRKRNKTIILTGDWNINTLKDTKLSRDLKELLENYNFFIHINTPTRQQSCIDHFASNIAMAIGDTIPTGLSDHDTAQLLTIPVKERIKPIRFWYKTVRDFSSENISKFKYCILNYSWADVFNCDSIEDSFNYFHTELCLLYNLCFPKYNVKVMNNKNKSNWLTKGIRSSCLTKRHLRISYYKTKTKTTKTQYRNYSKLLKKCIKTSQFLRNKEYIDKSKNKCRATWQLINNDENNFKINTIDHLTMNSNDIINDPTRIASEFNQYFINLPKIYIPTNNNSAIPKPIEINNSTFFLTPVDILEIKNIIKSLNNTYSTGYDEICTKILKTCIDELSPLLTHLVNVSFINGIFPSKLKFSVVKPVFKKGEKDCISNYRPITLIPVISKIFEKAFHKRLMSFCTKFSLIAPEQHGFQRGKSTSLACFRMVREISYFMNRRVPVSMILFDMSRAFDYVCHKTLLSKLESYGIRGHALDWIRTYLGGRVQRVEINKINKLSELTTYTSNYEEIGIGVPQGSILGPLLFILYINDIPSTTHYPMTLFADDISIIINKTKNVDYENEINLTIKKIINWLTYNNLCANVTKTKYIQFYNKNATPPCLSVTYNNEQIVEVNKAKFLGIDLDSNLTWKEHVDVVCERINRFTYALYRLTTICNQKTALMAYHGYVCSALRYGLVLWGNSVDLNRAFLIQKKCLRSMCGAGPLDSCRPLFKKLKLLTLPSMYIFEICLFVKNNMELFKKKADICNFNTRYPNRLVTMPSTTTCFSRNSYNMAVKLFNKLPDALKDLPMKKFKVSLKKYLCVQCFYSTEEFLKCTIRIPV